MGRFTRRRAALVVVGVLAAIAYLGVERSGGDSASEATSTSSGRGRILVPSSTSAGGGEVVFGEATIQVGATTLRVQVADTLDERALGLMHRDSLEPFAGMLFVFESDTQARFTMSSTPLPLTIGFYDRAGERVAGRAMSPCDDVPERCPTYSADATYRYALEVPRGALPAGRLEVGALPSS